MTAGSNVTPELAAEHGITAEEYQRLLDALGRDPNVTELGIFSVMWSEHCSYKSSRVWLKTEEKDGKIFFKADSDAIITKGMVALMIRVLSNQKPEDIVKADLKFVKQIGLTEHLSPTRANGLVSMINRMKQEALLRLKNQ